LFFGFFQGFSDECCCFKCKWKKKRQKFQSVLKDHEIRQLFDFKPPCNETNDSQINGEDLIPSLRGTGFSNINDWIEKEHEIVGGGFSNIIPELFHVRTSGETKEVLGVVAKKTFSIFKLKGKTPQIDKMDLSDLMASFSVVLEKLTSDALKQMNPNDQIQIILSTESGAMQRPVSTKLSSVKNFDFVKLLLLSEQYFQSNATEVKLSDGVRLEFVTVKMNKPSAGSHKGGKRHKFLSVLTAVESKTSCVKISNDDNLCMSRCISVSLVKQNLWSKMFGKTISYRLIRRNEKTIQTKAAMKLCDEAGVSYLSVTGVEEAKKFEKTLKICIKIFDAEAFLEIVYAGCPITNETRGVVYLLRSGAENEGHFDLITDMKKFLGKNFTVIFAIMHMTKFTNMFVQILNEWCFTCYRRDCKNEISSNQKRCLICNRKFRNDDCFKSHSNMTQSNCKIYKCFGCDFILKRKELSPGVWEKILI